jgi:putative Ig domain-containing protein
MRCIPTLFFASVAIAVLSSCGGGDSGPQALSIIASSPPAGTAGETYAGYTFTASGGTPPLTWSESGPLPPGLELNASGQLSGVPATAGTYPIIVGVSDSSMPGLTANVAVTLQVQDSAIVIAPASPPAGTLTYPYSFGFTASGGSPPYTWRSSGTVPPGLTVGSDGTVSGTPTQVGTFAFSLTATDSAQQPMSSPALATQIVISIPTKLTLNANPAPPAGVDGIDYGLFYFSATGGYLPLQWSITAGNLPPGLTLASDGSLSGTPTSVGTFMFTVMVTDSAAKPVSSSLPFTINVALPPPPTVVDQEIPTGIVGVLYPPLQFSATGGVPPLVWSETPPLNMGLSVDAHGVLSGTPTSAGQFPITLNVIDAASQSAPPFPTIVRVSLARPPATFTPTTGSMSIGRSGHSATLLLTGKVLVAGGGNGGPDATAELYDPATQTFAPTAGNMTEARSAHTATLLTNKAIANYGKVLIVGSGDTTAELYDPVSSTFAATGGMHHARTGPTATLLSSGKVLIVGGNTNSGDLVAELYNPASGTFSDTGSTTILRAGHTATPLLNGQVLIAGGQTATAELYDPATGTFSATAGDTTVAGNGHTATLLGAADGVQNGYVLIIGTSRSAELYDPSTRTFKRVGSFVGSSGGIPNRPAILGHTATLRKDGTTLAVGGDGYRGCLVFPFIRGIGLVSSSNAALFAPESDGFTVTGSLNTGRDRHTATMLPDGTVLIVGGTHHVFNGCTEHTTVLSSAELFK